MAVITSVLIGLSSVIHAEEMVNLGERAESSLDALEKASAYSFDNAGVGILIAYGTGNKVSAYEMGDTFIKELNKRGVSSRYFFYKANWTGMTIEYHIGYSALGPWSVDDAAMNIGQAVERIKAAQKIHEK